MLDTCNANLCNGDPKWIRKAQPSGWAFVLPGVDDVPRVGQAARRETVPGLADIRSGDLQVIERRAARRRHPTSTRHPGSRAGSDTHQRPRAATYREPRRVGGTRWRGR